MYWQTAIYLTRQIDNVLVADAAAIAGEAPQQLQESIDERLLQDPRRIKLAGLFNPGALSSAVDYRAARTSPC